MRVRIIFSRWELELRLSGLSSNTSINKEERGEGREERREGRRERGEEKGE